MFFWYLDPKWSLLLKILFTKTLLSLVCPSYPQLEFPFFPDFEPLGTRENSRTFCSSREISRVFWYSVTTLYFQSFTLKNLAIFSKAQQNIIFILEQIDWSLWGGIWIDILTCMIALGHVRLDQLTPKFIAQMIFIRTSGWYEKTNKIKF